MRSCRLLGVGPEIATQPQAGTPNPSLRATLIKAFDPSVVPPLSRRYATLVGSGCHPVVALMTQPECLTPDPARRRVDPEAGAVGAVLMRLLLDSAGARRDMSDDDAAEVRADRLPMPSVAHDHVAAPHVWRDTRHGAWVRKEVPLVEDQLVAVEREVH